MYITKFLVDYCIYPVIFFKFRKLSFFIKRQPGSSVFNDNLDIATPHSQRENLDNFCYPDPADGVAVVGNKCCLSCPSCRLIKNKLSFNNKKTTVFFRPFPTFNDNLDNLDNFCYPDPADGVAVVGNKCCLSCPSCRLIKNKLSLKTNGNGFFPTSSDPCSH